MRLAVWEQGTDKHLEGTWEECEAWIRDTIKSDFCWRIRPQGTPTNRELVAELVQSSISWNGGAFPEKNGFLERE